MKKNILMFFLIVILYNAITLANTHDIPLYQCIRNNFHDTELKQEININCKEHSKIRKIIDILIENYFFYEWTKNFNLLKEIAKSNPTNEITQAIFPYFNKSLLKNGWWLNFYCTWEDLIYQFGWFQIEGRIELEDWKKQILCSSWNNYLQYQKVFIVFNKADYPFLQRVPYIKDEKEKTRLLIGCITKRLENNEIIFFRNRAEFIPWTKERTNSIFIEPIKWKTIFESKIKQVQLNFLLEHNPFPKNLDSECENSWMKSYELKNIEVTPWSN